MFWRKTTLAATVAAVLVAGIVVTYTHDARAGMATSLENLLKESGFKYEKADKFFLVPINDEEDRRIVVALSEVALGGKDELRLVSLFVANPIVEAGARPSTELLRTLAELNDGLVVGKLSMGGDKGAVIYSSSFWLRGADKNTLTTECALAVITWGAMREKLRPFVNK